MSIHTLTNDEHILYFPVLLESHTLKQEIIIEQISVQNKYIKIKYTLIKLRLVLIQSSGSLNI